LEYLNDLIQQEQFIKEQNGRSGEATELQCFRDVGGVGLIHVPGRELAFSSKIEVESKESFQTMEATNTSEVL
jgi:hypothetical protein